MLPVHTLVVHFGSLTVSDGPGVLVHCPIQGLLFTTCLLHFPVLPVALLGGILQTSWVWLGRGAALVVQPLERSLTLLLTPPGVLRRHIILCEPPALIVGGQRGRRLAHTPIGAGVHTEVAAKGVVARRWCSEVALRCGLTLCRVSGRCPSEKVY